MSKDFPDPPTSPSGLPAGAGEAGFWGELTARKDFLNFWNEAVAELESLAPSWDLKACPDKSTKGVQVSELLFNGAGLPDKGGTLVPGWYARPSSAGPFPGIAIFHDYGEKRSPPVKFAREGFAAISITWWGEESRGWEEFLAGGIESAATFALKEAFLNAYRAVEFLETRPEVDTSRLGAMGHNMGGVVALTAGALADDSASFIIAESPSIEPLTFKIQSFLEAHPAKVKRIKEVLSYFAPLNFAPHIRAPVLISLRLKNRLSPPETVYAIYSALQCPKRMEVLSESAHKAGTEPEERSRRRRPHAWSQKATKKWLKELAII